MQQLHFSVIYAKFYIHIIARTIWLIPLLQVWEDVKPRVKTYESDLVKWTLKSTNEQAWSTSSVRFDDWGYVGSIHSHFVHSISTSVVAHFDVDSINAIFFVTVVWFWWRTLFNIEYHTMSSDEYVAFSSSNNLYKK